MHPGRRHIGRISVPTPGIELIPITIFAMPLRTPLGDPAGHRVIDGRDLAALAVQVAQVGAISARNAFPGIITAVSMRATAQVKSTDVLIERSGIS
jgi:hypothetical protein